MPPGTLWPRSVIAASAAELGRANFVRLALLDPTVSGQLPLHQTLEKSDWNGLVILDTRSDLGSLTQQAIAASDFSVVPVADLDSLISAWGAISTRSASTRPGDCWATATSPWPRSPRPWATLTPPTSPAPLPAGPARRRGPSAPAVRNGLIPSCTDKYSFHRSDFARRQGAGCAAVLIHRKQPSTRQADKSTRPSLGHIAALGALRRLPNGAPSRCATRLPGRDDLLP